MRCLDDDTVLGLVEGRLAAALLADVDHHLDDCATCREVVSQVARTQPSPRVLERGHALGRYVIGDLLGTGAMGRVYSAWEPELDRRVALKLLVTDGADARDRVVREAQAMARLDHPNVVGVHEVGTSSEGVYVAMELVAGETLRAWAAHAPAWREVAAVLVEIARGLAAVHAAGVVHRDIKPDNIIVGADGRTRLGDFGLARAGTAPEGAATDDVGLALGTPATAIAGTPAYMAPEVLRGGGATPASDQFSFGVTAYELIAGARPFTGTTWAALLAATAQRPPALRGVPSWLDDAIRRCLSPDPARRFPSLRELADHLAERTSARSPVRWIAGIAVAAALASSVTLIATRRAPSAGASCDVGAAELAGVWNPAVRAKLAGLGTPALRALDGFAMDWTTERDTTCRAARYEPAPRLAARTRCLDQRRAELGALVGRLGAVANGDRVADALASLPAPSECATLDAEPLPLDPARTAIVREVEAGLPAVRAAIALGDARPVLAATQQLVERARASGHASTLAETLLALADAQRGTSQLVDAALSARDAVAAAERGHADLLAARAWIARVATAGDRRELAVAEDFGAIAAAAVDRAGAPPRLAATLLRLRGLVAYNRGEFVVARTLLTEAHARFVEAVGKDAVEISTVESALGSVARAAGELDVAEGWHRRALDRDRVLRGAQHPDVARDLHNLAGVQRLRGELDAAAATYRAALAIEIATRGERSIEAGLTHNSLGLVHMAREDWASARTELGAARDALTSAGHGDRAFALHNLGLVAAATGDHAAALAAFTQAAATYATTIGDAAAPAIRLLLDRARAELALGRTRDGRASALRAQTAARTAEIAWITDAATALLAAAPSPRPVAIAVEPPVVAPRPAAPATVTPVPAPPPKPDVGVYGSTQTW